MTAQGVDAPPRVSAVIPTYNRPDRVVRAVGSALAQSEVAIEVIVVVDGRDPPTIDALAGIADPRLRVIVPERHLGNADARNAAVATARAEWVAFLDDDDVWMPGKLAAQLAAAARSPHPLPVVTCRMIGRNELGDFEWPRRAPRPGEPLSEYLFCRSTPFTGEGSVQTSTILARRALLERVPFSSGMPRYVDLDWLLRAAAVPGVAVEFVAEREPLAVWNMEAGRQRISNGADSEYTLAWARERRSLFTRRSYAAFLLTLGSMNAAAAGHWRLFLPLLREALREGEPSVAELLAHAAYFGLPDGLKRHAAAAFARLARLRGRLAATPPPLRPAERT